MSLEVDVEVDMQKEEVVLLLVDQSKKQVKEGMEINQITTNMVEDINHPERIKMMHVMYLHMDCKQKVYLMRI